MIDFIPVRDRGYVAAIVAGLSFFVAGLSFFVAGLSFFVAGLSFFVAALYPMEWRIEEFSTVMAAAMVPERRANAARDTRGTDLSEWF
ncbi:hypothetical protein [Natronomonas amylolytica]|uniref:hypothetical protein n=1 Tax=Natronomonas amylolytica TaxID=3108498 RepID=UPI00300B43E9